MELGDNIIVIKNTLEKHEVYKTLLQLCIEGTQQQIIEYFYKVYMSEL